MKGDIQATRGPRHTKAPYRNSQLKIIAFEKLPEKKDLPEYYVEVPNPISLDLIKKCVKRREYKTIKQFTNDMELMFENAKAFNEDDSQLHQDAILLQVP